MHMQGYLRDAFTGWVEETRPLAITPRAKVVVDGRKRPLSWLLERLNGCSDILPGSCCQELEIPAGSTYSEAIGFLKTGLDYEDFEKNFRLEFEENLRFEVAHDLKGECEDEAEYAERFEEDFNRRYEAESREQFNQALKKELGIT